MRVLIFSFVLSSCYCFMSRFPRWQTAGARGKLLCNNKPAAGVSMFLYQKGWFSKEELAAAKTDTKGVFKISGTIEEVVMNPQLRIVTWCNRKRDGFNSKMKEICIYIPPKFISNGKKVLEYWNVDIEIGTEANLCSHPSA
ncbi:unnamed protein product [Cylicocyclus nassatus]|uniref:Transthyretin-like family protein n=1 Tax=Cylicocyclus nassatus TaxID=53992 RepID=A0AA36MEH8_CYLNA|nr:unnamed protein product [Cylicocyclus nassatus]